MKEEWEGLCAVEAGVAGGMSLTTVMSVVFCGRSAMSGTIAAAVRGLRVVVATYAKSRCPDTDASESRVPLLTPECSVAQLYVTLATAPQAASPTTEQVTSMIEIQLTVRMFCLQ